MIWLLALSLVGMVGCTDPVTARLQHGQVEDDYEVYEHRGTWVLSNVTEGVVLGKNCRQESVYLDCPYQLDHDPRTICLQVYYRCERPVP